MPHRKRNDTIHELHRETIRKQSGLLLSAIDAATLRVRNFTPHGEALAELRKAVIETENIFTTDLAIFSVGTPRRRQRPSRVARLTC